MNFCQYFYLKYRDRLEPTFSVSLTINQDILTIKDFVYFAAQFDEREGVCTVTVANNQPNLKKLMEKARAQYRKEKDLEFKNQVAVKFVLDEGV